MAGHRVRSANVNTISACCRKHKARCWHERQREGSLGSAGRCQSEAEATIFEGDDPGRIFFPFPKRALHDGACETLLAKPCGLEEKGLEEDDLCRAVDAAMGAGVGSRSSFIAGPYPAGQLASLQSCELVCRGRTPRGVDAGRKSPRGCLVVIYQVKAGGRVGPLMISENQPPVPGNGQTPPIF